MLIDSLPSPVLPSRSELFKEGSLIHLIHWQGLTSKSMCGLGLRWKRLNSAGAPIICTGNKQINNTHKTKPKDQPTDLAAFVRGPDQRSALISLAEGLLDSSEARQAVPVQQPASQPLVLVNKTFGGRKEARWLACSPSQPPCHFSF